MITRDRAILTVFIMLLFASFLSHSQEMVEERLARVEAKLDSLLALGRGDFPPPSGSPLGVKPWPSSELREIRTRRPLGMTVARNGGMSSSAFTYIQNRKTLDS